MLKIYDNILILIGILVLVFFGYFIFVWNASTYEIINICSSITINTPYKDIQDVVYRSRFAKISRPFGDKEKTSTISSPNNFNRHICFLKINEGIVTKATYDFID